MIFFMCDVRIMNQKKTLFYTVYLIRISFDDQKNKFQKIIELIRKDQDLASTEDLFPKLKTL